MAAIVRVKRRRNEDPADSLILSCKKAKKGKCNEATKVEESESTTKLFKFARTVPENERNIIKHVREAIRKEKLEREYKQHLSENIIEKTRKHQRNVSSKGRFTVTSQKRSLNLDSLDTEKEEPAETEIDPEASRLFCLFDVVHGDVGDGAEERVMIDGQVAESDRKKPEAETDVLTCNGVPMVREKVKPKEKKATTPNADGCVDDFVYDIYFMNDAKFDFRNLEQILSIEACRDELTFGDDRSQEDEEVYDDEDDPNEEANWRNDYPDEETPFGNDDEDQDDEGGYLGGFDEDEEFDDEKMAALIEQRLKLNADDFDEYRDLSSEDEDHVYFNEPLPLGAAHKAGVAQGPTRSYESYKARVIQELDITD